MMGRPLIAEITAEFTLKLSSVFQPARKATIPRGEYQPLEPDEPESIEDVAVEGLLIEVNVGGKWSPVDLLDGVTRTPDVERLLANIAEAVDVETQEALMEAASDDAVDVAARLNQIAAGRPLPRRI